MRTFLGKKTIHELLYLNRIIDDLGDLARHQVVDEVTYKGRTFPLIAVELGSENLEDPVLSFFGGVHGLEKIGTEVILAYMESITSLIKWDESFKKRLKHSRLLFMPVINPVGIWLKSRSNGNGVDLMRNAPIEGTGKKTLYSGHRISNKLPWYRGDLDSEMEVETKAICKVVREKIFPSKLSMAVDVHSGFGAKDRFWFPYSRSNEVFPDISEVMALIQLFDKTHPHHFYTIEPTSYQYTIDGDVWDYLVEEFLQINKAQSDLKKLFLPWTLEMGSWIWLKKNPLQILNKMGMYHPLIPHRHQRILRRHFTLFDFLHRSVLFPKPWIQLNENQKLDFLKEAKDKWYEHKK